MVRPQKGTVIITRQVQHLTRLVDDLLDVARLTSGRLELRPRVVDFGQWWSQETEGLPLPLGGNAVRRDVPKEQATKIALDLKRSIAYALAASASARRTCRGASSAFAARASAAATSRLSGLRRRRTYVRRR